MQQSVITNDFQLEEKRFVYEGHFGPVLKLMGMVENDEKDWQISRRGTGLVSTCTSSWEGFNTRVRVCISYDTLNWALSCFSVHENDPITVEVTMYVTRIVRMHIDTLKAELSVLSPI